MYSTCLFCHTSLEANDAVEHFPIGRRLAFDPAKGRLWVVCRKCARWNLTPIEERWEAIEECERSYRATKLRVSTDQIGLARIAEGLELVRIGQPQRPEFAAWRYGDQFGRRRRKHIIQGAAITAAIVGVPFLGFAVGLSFGTAGLIFRLAHLGYTQYGQGRVVTRVRDADGNLLRVRGYDARGAVLLEPTETEPWGLRLFHRRISAGDFPSLRYMKNQEQTEFRGEDAMRVAAHLLPIMNATVASPGLIEGALRLATEYENPMTAFDRALARYAASKPVWKDYDTGGEYHPKPWGTGKEYGRGVTLGDLAPELRLALEMVSHETSERRALEGELHVLEEAWKDAEEIAAISDDLFVPEDISKRLAEMKGR
jgi:hypothetical protein